VSWVNGVSKLFSPVSILTLDAAVGDAALGTSLEGSTASGSNAERLESERLLLPLIPNKPIIILPLITSAFLDYLWRKTIHLIRKRMTEINKRLDSLWSDRIVSRRFKGFLFEERIMLSTAG
jgi:hypothetical protein